MLIGSIALLLSSCSFYACTGYDFLDSDFTTYDKRVPISSEKVFFSSTSSQTTSNIALLHFKDFNELGFVDTLGNPVTDFSDGNYFVDCVYNDNQNQSSYSFMRIGIKNINLKVYVCCQFPNTSNLMLTTNFTVNFSLNADGIPSYETDSLYTQKSLSDISFTQLFETPFTDNNDIDGVRIHNLTFSLIDSSIYNNINSEQIDNSYQNGYNTGYANGKNSGSSEGYQKGFADAKATYEDQDSVMNSIFSGILSIGLIPVEFLMSIFNFEVLGINFAHIVSAILTIMVTIILLRVILGGKNGDK